MSRKGIYEPMELPTYFADFLKEIRPTKSQKDDAKAGHKTLRKRLHADKTLSPIIIDTFLQGSYRRSTAIRPNGEICFDVDVIVVTKLDENYFTPSQAMKLFEPFLEEHYKDKWVYQGRSIKITLSYVVLDLVVTSAPSEADIKKLSKASVITDATLEEAEDWRLVESWVSPEDRWRPGIKALLELAQKEAEWKLAPLRIPDRDTKQWEDTHPLEQITWTQAKNKACNRHYINVVKALKWSRRLNHATPKYPKGYPLEHIIGQCCPSGISSVAEGVTLTLEEIAVRYAEDVKNERVPFLPDHGVPTHDVLHRLSVEDFAAFHTQVCEDAVIARRALDATTVKESANEWRKLFGDKFPAPPEDDDEGNSKNAKTGGYTPREHPTVIGGGRYA